ncbi:MAG: beta family protein [Burkholderiaceae bacterium]|nr:beta family protein [Burkholderiaceae bacterium]
MTDQNKVIYVPSLRMKMGELEGLRALRGDVADCILPLLIVPPLKERDSGSQEALFPPGEAIPDVGGILCKYWPRRAAFVDPRALFKEYGIEKAVNWLPELFKRARNLDVFAIPTANLAALEKVGVLAFKDSISESYRLKFGLRIQSGDMTDPNLNDRVQSVIANMGLIPAECAVFADFSDADLSDHSLVAPIIRSALEQLQTFGQWQVIAFQGTNFPETNPAKPGQTISYPRNEWRAWREAVKFDPSTAEHMVFGDFAADSAKMVFGGNGARPIPHCRYTTGTQWLVVRGNETGSMHEVMQDVFNRVLDSGEFSGASFSEADAYINHVARNNSEGAGNASTWRQINTTHHITRVVADIARVRGIPITELPRSPTGAQLALLDE